MNRPSVKTGFQVFGFIIISSGHLHLALPTSPCSHYIRLCDYSEMIAWCQGTENRCLVLLIPFNRHFSKQIVPYSHSN